MALAKKLRLKKKTDFDKVSRQGQIIQTPLFTISLLKEQSDGPKFGFVVSKKIDNRAVARNKIKRWLAEAVKAVFPRVKKDIYAVFYVKKNIKNANLEKIIKEIEKISQLFEES